MKFWILLFFLLPILLAVNTVEAQTGELIKSRSSSAVYYKYQGTRYAFPNEKIFYTWYQDFDDVVVITDEDMAQIPLGGLATYRPGVKLVKIQSNPKVYAVEGRSLRWITSPQVAAVLYGADWAQKIDDISDALFLNYFIGEDIQNNSDYDANRMLDAYQTIALVAGGIRNTCGNGLIESIEECDGGWYCSANCKLVGTMKKRDGIFAGGSSVYVLKTGERVPISGTINLRIESIDENANPAWGSRVGYSIWGKNRDSDCKLISSSGEFWTLKTEKIYRPFTTAFFELLGVTSSTATIRKYTGQQAKERCNQIALADKAYACNFYPDASSYFIESENFRVNFSSTESPLVAEYYARALENCYKLYYEKIPGLYRVSPFAPKWNVYPSDTVSRFESDFERISIPCQRFAVSTPIAVLKTVENGNCPMEESLIAHELAHVLFANTVLQGLYDESAKAELTANNYPGSVQLTEGLATYLPAYIKNNSGDPAAMNYEAAFTSYCGKDRLLNSDGYFNGAKQEQMIYANVLRGDVYRDNNYQAGYCFFKCAEMQCGLPTIDYLFNKMLELDGSTEQHASIFKFLTEGCDENKVKTLMQDFGFAPELLNAFQKFPNYPFASGLNDDGCID